jgi:pteridine reductase
VTAPVALVTGAARRVGAGIARTLHGAGFRIALHCHRSVAEAAELAGELNRIRAGSVQVFCADLLDPAALADLAERAAAPWGRLDVLVNNASRFHPSAVGETSPALWDELMATNLTAPFLLSQAAVPHLRRQRGCIVNLVDIHAERGLVRHGAYCAAKAGLVGLTKTLAKELAPEIRVNAVAPGAILWPEGDADEDRQTRILAGIPLGRLGTVADVAGAVRFLIEAPYVTGQVLAVDGGRGLAG